MLRVISDLTLCDRITKEYEAGVVASGVCGIWVTLNANEKFNLTTTTGATGLSYMIWNESNRDGTVGFSPDVAAIGKVTVLKGGYRALTDQIESGAYSSVSIGDALMAGDDGLLVAASNDAAGSKATVAYVAKKHGSVTYLGTLFTNVIEIYVQ
jgi:hypothetical protein